MNPTNFKNQALSNPMGQMAATAAPQPHASSTQEQFQYWYKQQQEADRAAAQKAAAESQAKAKAQSDKDYQDVQDWIKAATDAANEQLRQSHIEHQAFDQYNNEYTRYNLLSAPNYSAYIPMTPSPGYNIAGFKLGPTMEAGARFNSDAGGSWPNTVANGVGQVAQRANDMSQNFASKFMPNVASPAGSGQKVPSLAPALNKMTTADPANVALKVLQKFMPNPNR